MNVREEVLRVVSHQLGQPVRDWNQRLTADLGADAIDRMSICWDLEEIFGLKKRLPTDRDVTVRELVKLIKAWS